MRLNYSWFSVIIFILLSAQSSHALIVSGNLGFGSTQMTNEATETEGPLTQTFTVERLFHSKLSLGVEHIRSLTTGLITSASFSGLVGRYYLNAAPVKVIGPEVLGFDEITTRDITVFIGTGFGYGQSSRLPNDVGLSSNAAGFYMSPRAGADYQLTKNIGARGEVLYATTVVGTGTLTQFSLSAGLYWMF